VTAKPKTSEDDATVLKWTHFIHKLHQTVIIA
jgi:hypothetical protein